MHHPIHIVSFVVCALVLVFLLGTSAQAQNQNPPFQKLLGASWTENIGALNCTLYRDNISGEIIVSENTRSVCVNDYLGEILFSHVNTSMKNNVMVAEGYAELAKPVQGAPELSRFTINFLNINSDNTLQGRIDSPLFGEFLFDGAAQIPRMNVAYTGSEGKRIDISDLARTYAIQRQQTNFTQDDIWRINLAGQDSAKSLYIFQQLNKGLTAVQTLQKYIAGDDIEPIRMHVIQTLERF